MWELKLDKSVRLLKQTKAFVGLRGMVYGGACVVIAGVTLAVAWWTRSLFPEHQSLPLLFGLATGATAAYGLHALRARIAFFVSASHVAALVEVIDGRELPAKQMNYAHVLLRVRFGSKGTFIDLNGAIERSLLAVRKLTSGIATRSRALGLVFAVAGLVPRMALRYASSAILATALQRQDADPWKEGRRGLVLFAQKFDVIAKNLFLLGTAQLVMIVAALPFCGALATVVASLMPGSLSIVATVALAALFTYSVNKTLIEPLLMACLVQNYLDIVVAETPSNDWAARLDEVCLDFRGMNTGMNSDARVHSPPASRSIAPTAEPYPVEPTQQLTMDMLQLVTQPAPKQRPATSPPKIAKGKQSGQRKLRRRKPQGTPAPVVRGKAAPGTANSAGSDDLGLAKTAVISASAPASAKQISKLDSSWKEPTAWSREGTATRESRERWLRPRPNRA